MTRITDLSDTPSDIIAKLADGNPGAARVMADMFVQTPEIDPQNMLGGRGSVLFLDMLGIYGSRIWMLYKDVCGQDMKKMLAALRAVQMGLRTRSELLSAVDGGTKFDADAALSDVKGKLAAFAA